MCWCSLTCNTRIARRYVFGLFSDWNNDPFSDVLVLFTTKFMFSPRVPHVVVVHPLWCQTFLDLWVLGPSEIMKSITRDSNWFNLVNQVLGASFFAFLLLNGIIAFPFFTCFLSCSTLFIHQYITITTQQIYIIISFDSIESYIEISF